MQFIDLHCHIVAGIDDGAGDEETSVAMAQLAVADGSVTVVATPHIVEGVYDGADLSQRLVELRELLEAGGIELKLLPGAEVPISACAADNHDLLSGLALNRGRFILLETSDSGFEQLSQAVDQIRSCDLYPLLAHPERTLMAHREPDKLKALVQQGDVFTQVTAASLEGLFGKSLQKTALSLLKGGLVHVVASDAHGAGRRRPGLSASYNILCNTLGKDAAFSIMVDNPRKILAGELPVSGTAAARSGFWAKLRKGSA